MGRNLLEEAGIEYQPQGRNLLEEANLNYKTQEPEEKTSALGAFLRSAGRAPYDLAENLGMSHETSVFNQPGFIREKEYDTLQHPLASAAGSMVWGGPLLKELGLAGKIVKGASRLGNITKNSKIAEETQAAEEAIKPYEGFKESQLQSIKDAMEKANQGKAQLQEQYPNEPPLAEQPAQDLSNLLPGGTGEGLVPNAEAQTAEHMGQMGEYLGKGQQNDVGYQDIMKDMIKQNRAKIGSGYDELKSNFENKDIEIPNTRSLKDIHNEIQDLVKNNETSGPEATKLLKELSNYKETETIPASDVLTQFRTTDKLSKLAYDKAYERSASMTEEQRQGYRDLGKKYKEQSEKLSDLLEEHVDPQFQDTLKSLNKDWRRYASLYKNPLAREIEAQRGIAGNNIFTKMRGSEMGQQLLRELTLSNPEANKADLGHAYSENPSGLIEASPYEQQFIQGNKELPGMMDKLKQLQQAEQEAGTKAQEIQTEAKRVESAYKEDVKLEAAKKKAKEYAKQAEDKRAEIKYYEEQLKIKNNNLEKHMELQKKLAQSNKDLKGIQKAAKGLLVFAGVGLFDKAAQSLLKIIFK